MIISIEKFLKLIKFLFIFWVVNREKVELIGFLIVVELMIIWVLKVFCLGMFMYYYGVFKVKSIRCLKICSYFFVEIYLFLCLLMSFDLNVVMDIIFICSV